MKKTIVSQKLKIVIFRISIQIFTKFHLLAISPVSIWFDDPGKVENF